MLVVSDKDDHLRIVAGNADIFIKINMNGAINNMAVMLGMKALNE